MFKKMGAGAESGVKRFSQEHARYPGQRYGGGGGGRDGDGQGDRDGRRGDPPVARNSPTLIGAAAGTLGGPVWALAGTAAAYAMAGYPDSDWNTINVSAALLLMIVNVALFFLSLAVASKCVALGQPGGAEFASALLVTTPYVIYRALYPCRPPALNMGFLAEALAPAAIVRVGGGRRSGGGGESVF